MHFISNLFFFVLFMSIQCYADETENSGMIMIEIVEDPSFFELYGNYIYLFIILLALGLFFWRRYQQGRNIP